MTTQAVVLPSINRNLSQVIDITDSRMIAYGTRFMIYIFDISTVPPQILDNYIIRNAHRGKVLSLSFCKAANNLFLASVGEDKLLKIWDPTNGSFSNAASLEIRESWCVIEWPHGSTNSVCFTDYSGYVGKWNFITNKVIKMKTGSDASISVLASNPKSPELLAAGHGSGAISVLNIVTQALLHKLRAHSMEIMSLSWSAVHLDNLLSTSSDLSARLWKLGEEKPVNTYFYPSTRHRQEDRKNIKACGLCHPENPDVIFCSNVRGDLNSVTFIENESAKLSFFSGKEYDTGYKNVVSMLPYYDSIQKKHMFLTCDHLRVSFFDVAEEKLVFSIPFLVGTVFDLTLSNLHPDTLAICSGDGTLKVWKQNSEERLLDTTTIYIHHKVKIMTAVWHPTNEHILAYGVDEGRVGIVDMHKKKSIYSFETNHSGTVYSLQWGPCFKINESKHEFFLYSCGNGTIYINELNKQKEKAVDFDSLIMLPPELQVETKQSSEIAWNYDYSCFAVGSYKGYIDLFNDKLDFLTRIIVQIKNIEGLKWHPLVTFTSPEGSPYKSWIAVSGNDENIHVVDTACLSGKPESTHCKSTIILVGHKKRICSMSWSSHNDGHLATGSRDGTVQIWNVCTKTPIANYSWHKDMVYAVCWSALDPDVIFSGGTDNSLRIWKISEQSETCPPSKSVVVKTRSKLKLAKKRESAFEDTVNETFASQTITNSIHHSEEQLDTDDLSFKSKGDRGGPRSSFDIQLKCKRSSNLASIITNYSKEESFENVFKLVDHLCNQLETDATSETNNKLSSEDCLKIGLFSDQSAALNLLEMKAKTVMEQGNILKAAHLYMMCTNIKPLITEAAERKQLNDYLVAISPSVSVLFWHEMCEKYAIQLLEEEQYMRASIFYMLCGKLHDGLKLLSEKGKILEALAFAKAQLPESDPVVEHVLNKAAKNFSASHQVELEASCYLALKKPLQAARSMFCSTDPKYIYAATYICHKFNLKDEAESYAYSCMEKCLSHNDWLTFYKLIEQVESLKVYTPLIRVHEVMASYLKTLKKEDGLVSADVFGVNKDKALIWKGKVGENSSKSLLFELFNILVSEGIINLEDKNSLQKVQTALYDLEQKRKNFERSPEAHICIALWVTQIIISSLLAEFEVSLKYFNRIFSSAYNVVFLPKVMFWLFLPLDLYYSCSSKTFHCDIQSHNLVPSYASQFQEVYEILCSKFRGLHLSSLQDLKLSLHQDSNVSKALAVLSTQKHLACLEQSILLYFIDFYLEEMRRLTKRGWKFRCYQNISSICDKNMDETELKKVALKTENNVEELKSNSVLDNGEVLQVSPAENGENQVVTSDDIAKDEKQIKPENNSVLEKDCSLVKNGADNSLQEQNQGMASGDTTKDGKQAEVKNGSVIAENCSTVNDEEDSLKKLIETVLKEAEEKARSLLEAEEQARSFVETFGETAGEENPSTDGKENNSQNSCDINLKNELNKENISKENSTEKTCEFVEEIQSEHSQCWYDMNLCYDVIKYFNSALCKDEYAWLYYFENYLSQIDAAVAALVRKQKQIVALNISKSSDATKPVINETEIPVNNDICDNANDGASLQENICIDENVQKVDGFDVPKDLAVTSTSNDLNETKGLVKSCNIDSSANTVNSSSLNLKERREENLNLKEKENESNLDTTDNSASTTGERKNSFLKANFLDFLRKKEEGLNLGEKENESDLAVTNINNSVNPTEEIIQVDINGKTFNAEELGLEQKRVSSLIDNFKEIGFLYPNPLVASSNVMGVCYDIFYKNPCTVVKEKFHELSHEVLEWKKKFHVGDTPVECEICVKASTVV